MVLPVSRVPQLLPHPRDVFPCRPQKAHRLQVQRRDMLAVAQASASVTGLHMGLTRKVQMQAHESENIRYTSIQLAFM